MSHSNKRQALAAFPALARHRESWGAPREGARGSRAPGAEQPAEDDPASLCTVREDFSEEEVPRLFLKG